MDSPKLAPPPTTTTADEEEETQKEKGNEDEETQSTPTPTSSSSSSFPIGRIKKIVKIDGDIKKVTSEALHLISLSAHLFLCSLASAAGEEARTKKRKTVKLDHIRSAVRSHQPTSDFLLDSLPAAPPAESGPRAKKARSAAEKPLPARARRIDSFFIRKE